MSLTEHQRIEIAKLALDYLVTLQTNQNFPALQHAESAINKQINKTQEEITFGDLFGIVYKEIEAKVSEGIDQTTHG